MWLKFEQVALPRSSCGEYVRAEGAFVWPRSRHCIKPVKITAGAPIAQSVTSPRVRSAPVKPIHFHDARTGHAMRAACSTHVEGGKLQWELRSSDRLVRD